jgi:hypothetical protein
MRRLLLPLLAFLFALAPTVATAQQTAARFEAAVSTVGTRWFKGNTHSHTINTDGDSPPDTVVKWYKDHGYNFLVVSDHDTITEPTSLARFVDPNFVLVQGEEVTGSFNRAPVHLTAINLKRIVKPMKTAPTLLATLQSNVDAIRAAGGIPLINHPNYRWALDRETIAATTGVSLFELYNGHPHVHNAGGGGAPSTEQIWDELLTSRRRIYGVASDDSHHFRQWGKEEFVNPGRAWIYVRASSLDPATIVGAIEAGQFYASNGVELEDVIAEPQALEIRIKQMVDFKYTIEFIGDGGRILQKTDGLRARYELRPGVTYVRVRVTDSAGRRAWTQPVFVAR